MELSLLLLRWLVYISSFCFFPPAAMSGCHDQARLSVPGPMDKITNAKALVTPARGSRGATGGEMGDATVLYLGIRKELRKNARFWETSSGEKM